MMTRTLRTSAALISLGLVFGSLTGCAPEPGSLPEIPSDAQQKQEPEGGSWPEQNPDEVFEKTTTLPEDFPAAFVVPEGAIVQDAGSRGPATWFVVFLAPDTESARALWEEVITAGGFTVDEETETPEGGIAATLVSDSLQVSGMTIPQEEGAVQISYDIEGSGL